MDLSYSEDQSDDEVFIGKLSLKEVKKHILLDKNRQTIDSINTNTEGDKSDESIRIIETHSLPDLTKDTIPSPSGSQLNISNSNISPNDNDIVSNWNIKSSDDSFLKIEKMMENFTVSPRNRNGCGEDLDNTLHVIEHILNNRPVKNANIKDEHVDESIENVLNYESLPHNIKTEVKTEAEIEVCNNLTNHDLNNHCHNSPKNVDKLDTHDSPCSLHYYTPLKINKCSKDVFATPLTKPFTPIFKTPMDPVSNKKLSTLKRTPSKINTYQHITSPVASYIRNCPQVPLIKDIHPKKPLPGTSSIPKPVIKQNKLCNKENVILPSVAYRSAKRTQVIDIPDEEKLPQSQWAKKITSSLPRPVVIKHDHREVDNNKKSSLEKQENSFADLSLHQAEVSVCIQKSAFNKLKKP